MSFVKLMLRQRTKNLFEGLAWLCVLLTCVLMLLSLPNLMRLLMGDSVMRIARESVVPRDVLKAARTVREACQAAPKKYTSTHKAQYQYEPLYNAAVDRASFALIRLDESTNGNNGEEGARNRNGDQGILRCIARGLSEVLNLQDPDAVVPEVLWITIAEPTSRPKEIAVWPAMLPSQRNAEILRKLAQWRSTLPDDHALTTNWAYGGYDDYFTAEKVVDLRDEDLAAGRSPERLLVIVSVRVASLLSTFKLAIFLNFCALVIFCTLNWAVKRRLPSEEFVSWYRAWLCWALVYTCYSLVYLVRLPFLALSNYRDLFLMAAPVFSIANDSFFLIVGLYMLQWRDRRRRYKLALLSGSIVLCLFVLAHRLIGGNAQINSRVVESAFSVAVSLLLARAFVRVLKKRRVNISGLELFGSQFASVLVGAFFGLLALHQILIAIWRGRPGLEEIFWILSPVMKLCLMSVFFMTELTDRYWGEGEVGLAVFNRLEQGVIAVDAKRRIVNINDAGAAMLGLPKATAIGKDIKEVLFRSLFESERLFKDLVAEGNIRGRRMLTKDYRGTDIRDFRAVHRSVSAQIIGEAEREGIYALIYVDRGAGGADEPV